jgi:hypothetical protein
MANGEAVAPDKEADGVAHESLRHASKLTSDESVVHKPQSSSGLNNRELIPTRLERACPLNEKITQVPSSEASIKFATRRRRAGRAKTRSTKHCGLTS